MPITLMRIIGLHSQPTHTNTHTHTNMEYNTVMAYDCRQQVDRTTVKNRREGFRTQSHSCGEAE